MIQICTKVDNMPTSKVIKVTDSHLKHLKTLGINKKCGEELTWKEVRKVYLQRALITHPDKGGDPQKFAILNSAYDVMENKAFEERPLEKIISRGTGSSVPTYKAPSSQFSNQYYWNNLSSKDPLSTIERRLLTKLVEPLFKLLANSGAAYTFQYLDLDSQSKIRKRHFTNNSQCTVGDVSFKESHNYYASSQNAILYSLIHPLMKYIDEFSRNRDVNSFERNCKNHIHEFNLR